MTPMQIEQNIADLLSPRLSLPVVSFAFNPTDVKKIGKDGLCSVLYQGSYTEGKVPQTKRIMSISVLLFVETLPKTHDQMNLIYRAFAESQLNGCGSVTIVDDEIVQLEGGLYHAEINLEAMVFT